MAAKLIILTYKIVIHLHLAAESSTICISRSRRPVRKISYTPSYTIVTNLTHIQFHTLLYYYPQFSSRFSTRLDIFTTMNFQVTFFYVMTSCSEALEYRRFRRTCYLLLKGEVNSARK